MKTKIIGAIALIAVLIAAADQQALFGYREVGIGDYVRLVFEFVDADTRAPVSNVHVICTKPMVRSACSESDGPKLGQTTVNLAVFRKVKKTLFFEQSVGYSLGRDGILFLTFVAPNHEQFKMHIADNDPILSGDHPYRVELQQSQD